MRVQLHRVRAFWTQVAARNGRIDVVFDLHDFIVLVIDDLPATDSAIRADGTRLFAILELRCQRESVIGHRLMTGTVTTLRELPINRPALQDVGEHATTLPAVALPAS